MCVFLFVCLFVCLFCKILFRCASSVVWLIPALKNRARYDFFDSGGVYSREINNMFLVRQVSVLVQNFNIGIIILDIINVINVKLYTLVLFIDRYLFIPLSVTFIAFKVTAVSNSFD